MILSTKKDKLAIIAGSGSLPQQVLEDSIKNGWDVHVLSFGSDLPENSKNFKIVQFKTVSLSKVINYLKYNHIKNLVMVGYINRPDNILTVLNLRYLFLLLKYFRVLNSGDSKLLTSIIRVLENKGFNVIGAHQISNNLTLKKGVYSKIKPSANDNKDILLAYKTAKIIGNLDIGQGVIVSKNRVLAVEGAEGTNLMLEKIITINSNKKVKTGLLLKTSQNIQDKRVDLPTVGPETIHLIAKAGLKGIAITSDDILIIKLKEVVELINSYNLFFVVMEDDLSI